MIKLVRALAATLCLIPVSVAAALAAPREDAAKAIYVVQLEGAPLARSAAVSASSEGPRKLALDSVESLRTQERLRLQQDEAIAAIGGALGREPMPLQRYSVAFNGLALELTEDEAAALAQVPGVRRVQPSVRYHISSDAGPSWTGAPGIWNGTATGGLPGTQGEGMIIGIIDTGVTFGHPSFTDVGGDSYNHVNPRGAGNYLGWCNPSNPDYDPSLACNDKLIGAWSHEEAGSDPRDDQGHGTHTASIAAGNHQWVTLPGTSLTRLISGVAPHANLVTYDACDSDGYCYSWVLLAAVDQAVADGVDVINMSVVSYSSSPWHNSLALALLEARDAGIFVAAALEDSYDIGTPGNAPWVLAVGASTHDRRFSSSLVGVSGGSSPLPNLTGQGWTNSYGPAGIVRGGDFGDYDCSAPFPPGTFGGRIVVCDHYYYYSVVEKGQNVLAGGAGGLILVDAFGYDLQDSTSNVLPWLYLPYYSGGSTLWSWLATGSGHTAQIGGTTANVNAANGDRLWPGSSTGGDLGDVPGILKPDVVAPGQDILAAYPISGVEVLSGTSMASAHAAGAAALLLDLHPTWTPAEVQSALQTTGVTVTRADGTAANLLNMGGGRLSLGPAARAGLVFPVTTAQYEAVDPWNDGNPKELNLASLLDEECSMSCGWTRTVRSTLSTSSTWNATVEAPAGVTLTVVPSSFTLGPGGTQSLQITASGPTSLSDWKFGRIVLTESGAQAPPARLPLATFWVYHYQLTVAKSGSGAGVVTSNPAGINCGSTCSALFPEYTYVTLTAAPSPGSVFVGWGGYCDGPGPTCAVSMYGSQSVTAYFNPPNPDKALANQAPLKDSIKGPVYNGTWNYYSIDLGSGTGELVVDLLDLTADAALYVRHGNKPTYDEADCVDDYSYDANNRRCVILNPAAGRWWIGVSNQDENVLIRYTIRAAWGNASDRELANRSPYGDFLSSAVSGTAWKYYFVDLAAGGTGLTVDLTHLSADADLYVRHGAKPDRSNNDCASSEGSTLPDRCLVSSPAAGRWWIGINNFSTSTITYRLTASWQTVDTAADLYIFSPCRVLDTRSPSQPLVSGVPRTLQIAGLCGIPSTAKAVVANVTITGATGLGNLTLYPGDEGTPVTSTHNFGPDQTRANNVILKLDSGGAGNLGALATVAGVGQVHVIVDVSGYYE